MTNKTKIKWDEEKLKDAIFEIMNELGLKRMPTLNELNSVRIAIDDEIIEGKRVGFQIRQRGGIPKVAAELNIAHYTTDYERSKEYMIKIAFMVQDAIESGRLQIDGTRIKTEKEFIRIMEQ